MPTFPPDRFDAVPEDLQRVGAHRAPKRPGRAWITVAWAALFSGIIVATGVFAMFVINDRVSFENPFARSSEPEPVITEEPTVEPTIDPAVDVVVLNGTETDGLAGEVGDVLTAQGWNVGTRGNADSLVETTTVFYSEPGQEGAAKGIVQSLGAGELRESTAFVIEGAPPRIVVVIGTDYTAPAV